MLLTGRRESRVLARGRPTTITSIVGRLAWERTPIQRTELGDQQSGRAVETVLGVSITATEVRAALVEGANADGVLIEQDVFDIAACDGSATPNTADQVTAVVLGTQQGALAAGHHLASTGVAWSDETDAAAVREALVARGLDDVLLVSELNAAAALAQAVGRTLAYDKTALMFVDRDTATLAVVDSIDGSVAKILSQKRYGTDAVATLNEMIPSLRAEEPHPQGMFVVGSGVDVTAIKAHLTHVLSLPVIASEEPQIALARGAALASANTPRFDTSTIGLAYSQEAGETVVHPTALVDGTTDALHPDEVREGRKPFLLVGSTLAVFTVGITALAIAMAVNVQPAAEQNPGETASRPNELVPPPTVATAEPAPPQMPTPLSAPITAARHIIPPAPPPRRVFVGDVAPAPAAPPPAAPGPAAPPPPVIQWPVLPLPPILLPPNLPQPVHGPPFKIPKIPPGLGGKGHGNGHGKGH